MKKFQLHQRGIEELQRILYALPDAKLAAEVLALRTDFKEWVKTKFELQPSELNFIDDLSPQFAAYAAIKSSNFLALRKPIRFAVIELRPELVEAGVQHPNTPL